MVGRGRAIFPTRRREEPKRWSNFNSFCSASGRRPAGTLKSASRRPISRPCSCAQIPVEQVLVRRIDQVRSGLETVAIGLSRRRPADARDRLFRCRAGIAAGVVSPGEGCPASRHRECDVAGSRASDRRFPSSKVIPNGHRGDALDWPAGRSGGSLRRVGLLGAAGLPLRAAPRRSGATAAGAVFGGAWRTTCGCGKWPPCARPPRPTNARC